MGLVFAGIAGLIHVYIFVMESLIWGTPKINKAFNVTPAQAEENKTFAFNQGFYNLFLAIATLLGIYLSLGEHRIVGLTLMAYSCFSMLGASLVLLYSNKRLVRPACIQGLPPAIALILLCL